MSKSMAKTQWSREVGRHSTEMFCVYEVAPWSETKVIRESDSDEIDQGKPKCPRGFGGDCDQEHKRDSRVLSTECRRDSTG